MTKNYQIVVLLAITEELQRMSDQIEKVVINKLPIRLGQFLKLANMVQDGFEATARIQNCEVKVNGKVETKRGRKLQALDEITFSNKTWSIATTS
jgi:ribosome-associated protein